MAFVPLKEVNYDVHAIPERHAVTTHPESLANSDEVIDANLSKSAKDRKVVTLTTQLLIAKVTQLTAVCEAVGKGWSRSDRLLHEPGTRWRVSIPN